MALWLLLAVEFALGGVAAVSDLRDGKIYNRHLVIFGISGIAIYSVFHRELVDGYLPGPIINAIVTLLISFLLFYTRFWSAGDAKLFWLMALLMPYSFYPQGPLFSAFFLLMTIFCLAFVYVLGDSIYCYIVDGRRPPAERRFVTMNYLNRNDIFDWVLRYVASSLLLGAVYKTIGFLLPEVVNQNQGLLLVSGALLLILIYRRLRTRSDIMLTIAVGLLANFSFYYLSASALTSLLDIRGPLIALLTIVVMRFAAAYDHMRIPVSELKPGMILSALTVAGFGPSRIKGLPRTTTETTDSRLAEAEVAVVRRWGAANPANSHIIVVSHVPLAPFILVGSMIYALLAHFLLVH